MLLLAPLAGVLLWGCWQAVWFFACYNPFLQAEDAARGAARAGGYRMEGYFGTFIAESDDAGGCELQFEFHDLSADPPVREVTLRMRRGWALGGWKAVEMREGPIAKGGSP